MHMCIVYLYEELCIIMQKVFIILFTKGCLLKIFDKKGGKLKTEVHSQCISAIDILQSKRITCEHQLYFRISFTTKEPPVCLYAEADEEFSHWVASLVVTISEGMNGVKYIIVKILILYMQNVPILINHHCGHKT